MNGDLLLAGIVFFVEIFDCFLYQNDTLFMCFMTRLKGAIDRNQSLILNRRADSFSFAWLHIKLDGK